MGDGDPWTTEFYPTVSARQLIGVLDGASFL